MDITICSGFQTGSDFAAIKAAKEIDFQTTGWMPKGFKTKLGPKPEYKTLYGARESDSSDYKPRTWANVAQADLTLRLAVNFSSPGEKCTLNAIKHHNKPYIDINLNKMLKSADISANLAIVAEKIAAVPVKVLNVAGNCDAPLLPSLYGNSIEEVAYYYLVRLFAILKER
jgi:hypothetical protein